MLVLAASAKRARVLWLLMRPRGAFFVAALPLLGFGFGHWDYALSLRNGARVPLLIATWLALHAGTMWLNAALDRDEGEVLFGGRAVVPAGIEQVAYVALAASLILGWWTHTDVGVCVTICTTLSVLYSHPRTMWKAHPLLGPAVNGLGYGIVSPAAGWALVEVPVSWRAAAVVGVLGLSALAVYFVAQVFQEFDDSARGYRTLVANHGPKAVLLATRLCMGAACTFTLTLAASGWLPRVTLFAAPLCLKLDRQLSRAVRARRGFDERVARDVVLKYVRLGVAMLAMACVDYGYDVLQGARAAGLATARGHPAVAPKSVRCRH